MRGRRNRGDEAEMPEAIGRYRIDAIAGHGGMGTVYRAHDPALSRVVALKVLRSSLHRRNDREQARIFREAQALARLSHPNVVQVFDVGQVEGTVYIAMEYVEGPTLKEWVQRPRRQREILRAFVEAGHGLLAAHRAGLVHRDFKPANVLMGNDERPRVTDFGLAREHISSSDEGTLAEATASADEVLTQAGTVMGTPAYMAPEQHERGLTDPRTDQYAFCVALYEALSGTRPFAGLGGGRELVEAKRREDFSALSGVPRNLRHAIARGLRAEPADRFPSMEELLAALEPHVAPRNKRRWVSWSVALVALVSIGTVYATPNDTTCAGISNEPAWDEEQRAAFLTRHTGATASAVSERLDGWQRQWADTREAVCGTAERSEPPSTFDLQARCLRRARQAASALVSVAVQRSELGAWAVIAAERLPDPQSCAAAAVSTQPGPAPPSPDVAPHVEQVREEIEQTLVLLRAGELESAQQQSDALARRAAELGYEPLLVQAQHLLARIEIERSETEDARRRLEGAFFSARRLGMDHDAAKIAVQLTYLVGYTQGDFDAGRKWADHGMALLRQLDEADTMARLYDVQGSVEFLDGKLDESARLYQKALEIWSQEPQDHIIDRALARENLAGVAYARHDYAAAQREYEAVLALRSSVLGEDHPDVAFVRSNLAATSYAQGDYEGAAVQFQRAAAAVRQHVGDQNLALAAPLEGLASCLHQLGRYDEAGQLYREVLGIREAAGQSEHPRIVTVVGNLGLVLDAQGRDDEAMAHFARALALSETIFGPDHPDTAIPLGRLGIAQSEAGQYDEAEASLRRALTIYEQHLPPGDVDIGRAATSLADLLLQVDRPREALPLYRRALAILTPTDADPRLQARAELGLGRTLAALGDSAQATSHLGRAVTLFETHHDEPNLAEARQALAAVASG